MADRMLPIIMNTDFERLAVIDDYISFIWTSRYYSPGDFELCVDVTPEHIQLLKPDYYILRDDDENVGIIEKIVIQQNADNHVMLIVTGRFLGSIIGRRIISEQTTVTGKVSACIEKLIDENIVNATMQNRRITNFIIDDTYESSDSMEAQYTGKNLLDTVSSICTTYQIGFKVTLNAQNQFVFALYEGLNRTYNQSVNTWAVFSDQYDNLLSSQYEENHQNIVSAVLVAGEGEGLDRKTRWVLTTNISMLNGLGLHESYLDQRNIRSNNGEITPAEYDELLFQAGYERLTRYTTAFTGKVYFDNVKYKQDVNLGDLVVIENSNWGINVNSRLVEVIESVSESGEYSIVPTFGL